MNSEYLAANRENLMMAQMDLAVLKDLFHTLNDAGISYSSLNSSIALLEKYIEDACILNPDFEESTRFGIETYALKNPRLWKKSNMAFAS